MTGPLTPRIYVASLAAYNSGYLHGIWVDPTVPLDDVNAAIGRMLRTSPVQPSEEWAIHDYEGFGPLRLDEYESIPDVVAVAQGIAQHGAAYAVWVSLLDPGERHAAMDLFEDHFEGVYESYREFGEQLLEMYDVDLDRMDLPESVRDYVRVDTEALGRDWAGSVRSCWFDDHLYVFFE